MARELMRQVMGPLVRWARMRGRVAIAVVGALPGRDAEAWATPRLLPLGMPTDAADPRQADVLVVVGRISHKLAPFVVRAHAAMARPASVLAIELEATPPAPRLYASIAALTDIIPVDVVVRGLPPHPDAISRALALLERGAAEVE